MRVRAVSIALLLSDVVVIGGGIVEGDNVECSVIIIGIVASAIVVLVVVGSSVNSGVVVESEASWPPCGGLIFFVVMIGHDHNIVMNCHVDNI